MYCIHCGIELNGSENFCPSCGTAVVPEDELVNDKKARRKKFWRNFAKGFQAAQQSSDRSVNQAATFSIFMRK